MDLCLKSPKPTASEIFGILENFDVTFDWLFKGEITAGQANKPQYDDLILSSEEISLLKQLLKR